MSFPDAWPMDPDVLERSWRAWATADLILCEEAWLRVYTFDAHWAPGQRLGKVDNGGGDMVYALFIPTGTVIKGFDHESEVSRHARDDGEPWPGIYEGMPHVLWEALDDPALEPQDVTFCLWRSESEPQWWRGVTLPSDLDDGSGAFLDHLTDRPEAYLEWAQDYYERPIDGEAVAALFAGTAMTQELIRQLNPERDVAAAMSELLACGLIVPES